MIQEKMIQIKEEYESQTTFPMSHFLCHVADDVGVGYEFREYLVNNIDETMISCSSGKYNARWFAEDRQGRLDWLNKHIEILGYEI